MRVPVTFGRAVWSTIGIVGLLLFLSWFALVAAADASLAWYGPVLIALVYALFLLEGLQVSGLLVKTHSEADMRRYIAAMNRGRDDPGLMRTARTFIHEFSAFLTGRQILVICSVVSIAGIIDRLGIPADSAIAQTVGQGAWGALYLRVVNSTAFAFFCATLIPAWVGQLLPQFFAEKRALRFMALPFAGFITRLSVLIDHSQAGRPARWALEWLDRSRLIGEPEDIPLGREALYRAMLEHHGNGRGRHSLDIRLGQKTVHEETIEFVYRMGDTRAVRYRFRTRAAAEIERVALELPVGITHGEPRIESHRVPEGTLFIHTVTVPLDTPLPRRQHESDRATLALVYTTDEDTSGVFSCREAEIRVKGPVAQAIIRVTPATGRALTGEAEFAKSFPVPGQAHRLGYGQA